MTLSSDGIFRVLAPKSSPYYYIVDSSHASVATENLCFSFSKNSQLVHECTGVVSGGTFESGAAEKDKRGSYWIFKAVSL